MNIHKFCINCEIEFQLGENNNGDFCSDECADAFNARCDPAQLDKSRNTNPDALPTNELLNVTLANRAVRNLSGHLPPNTEEAIASMLRIGGVNQEAINKVMATKSKADVNTNSQNETEPK